MNTFLKSEPYPYPYNGDLRPENTCLIIIDMQFDFCAEHQQPRRLFGVGALA